MLWKSSLHKRVLIAIQKANQRSEWAYSKRAECRDSKFHSIASVYTIYPHIILETGEQNETKQKKNQPKIAKRRPNHNIILHYTHAN